MCPGPIDKNSQTESKNSLSNKNENPLNSIQLRNMKIHGAHTHNTTNEIIIAIIL